MRITTAFLLCALVGVGFGVASGEARQATEGKPVVIQYRTTFDALAPGKFLPGMMTELTSGGMPFSLDWHLPELADPDARKAQEKARKAFEDILALAEKRGANGIEFRCQGETKVVQSKLRIYSVPQLTPEGLKRLEGK